MSSGGWVLAWVQRRRAPVADALLAAAVTAMVLVDLSSPTDAVGVRRTDALGMLLSLLQTVPLAFRRLAPLATFILILLGVCIYYPLGYEVTDGTLATFVGVYTVAAYESRRKSLVGLGLLSWGLGEYVRARRAYTAQVEALAERLDRARELEARQAAWPHGGRPPSAASSCSRRGTSGAVCGCAPSEPPSCCGNRPPRPAGS